MIRDKRKVVAYDFSKNYIEGFTPEEVTYWRDVGTVPDYYRAHMDLLGENPVLKLGPNTNGQILYFFGARHTNDPADHQFESLKEVFYEFLKVGKEENIIFSERIVREVPESYEEGVRREGEAGAIQWLAQKSSINIICPEPSEAEQRKLLSALFEPQTVAYAMVAQNLSAWFRHASSTSFDEAVARVLNREAKFSEIYGFLPDKLWFEGQHKKLFGEQKLEDKSFLDSIVDPRKDNTVINNVVVLRSKLRNEHILSVIKKMWEAEKNIFIVYGKGHLVSLEQPLKELALEA